TSARTLRLRRWIPGSPSAPPAPALRTAAPPGTRSRSSTDSLPFGHRSRSHRSRSTPPRISSCSAQTPSPSPRRIYVRSPCTRPPAGGRGPLRTGRARRDRPTAGYRCVEPAKVWMGGRQHQSQQMGCGSPAGPGDRRSRVLAAPNRSARDRSDAVRLWVDVLEVGAEAEEERIVPTSRSENHPEVKFHSVHVRRVHRQRDRRRTEDVPRGGPRRVAALLEEVLVRIRVVSNRTVLRRRPGEGRGKND